MKKKGDLVFDWLFAILLLSLPLSMAIPNIVLLLLIGLFFVKKGTDIQANSYTISIAVFVSFLLVKALVNNSFIDNFYLYKHFIALFVITFLATCIQNKNTVKIGFLAGVLIAVFISLFHIIVYYFEHHSVPLANNQQVHTLLIGERPYLGFMCFLAVILLLDFLRQAINNRIKITIVVCILLLVFFVFLIAARLSLLLLLIVALFKIVQNLRKQGLTLKLVTLAIFTLAAILILRSDNLKKRFHIKESYTETFSELKNQEPRVVIWKCCYALMTAPQFNTFFGYDNLKEVQKNLNGCYATEIENRSKKEYYVETQFNTHNQFFDIYLQGGLIALLMLFTMFFMAFKNLKKNQNEIIVVLSFVAFFIVENVFQRQLGVYLFAIFIPLFFKKRAKH